MEADYVIVGGGSAGAVLAARLSEEAAAEVVLIEAGGPGVLGLGGWRGWLPRAAAPRWQSLPQAALGGRRLDLPGGIGLGGSFAAGGARPYLRGHPEDYGRWQALGADGWDWPGCLPAFLRAEDNQRGASGLHASGGPLAVADTARPSEVALAFLAACEAEGIAPLADFNARPFEGAGLYQHLRRPDGGASGPVDYLRPARAWANLRLLTGLRADRIELAGGRAVAVQAGRRRIAARREIILCAGGIGTPLLLLRSGIGPPDGLAGAGIACRHPLSGLGEGIQLQPGLALALPLPREAVLPRAPVLEAGAFLRSEPYLPRPDLRLELLAGGGRLIGRLVLMRPAARGRLGLSPQGAPLIDPACLAAEADRLALARGMKRLAGLLQAGELAPWRAGAPLLPDPGAGIEAASPLVGACRMGHGEGAVLQPSLALQGLEGLRVADASVMPELIAGEVGVVSGMIAERAAGLIRGGM